MYKLNWATGSTHGGAVQPIPWNCGRVTKPQAKWNHTYVKSEAARSTLRKNKNLNISYIIVTDIKVWWRAGMREGVTPWTSMRPAVAVVQGPAQNTLKWGKKWKITKIKFWKQFFFGKKYFFSTKIWYSYHICAYSDCSNLMDLLHRVNTTSIYLRSIYLQRLSARQLTCGCKISIDLFQMLITQPKMLQKC